MPAYDELALTVNASISKNSYFYLFAFSLVAFPNCHIYIFYICHNAAYLYNFEYSSFFWDFVPSVVSVVWPCAPWFKLTMPGDVSSNESFGWAIDRDMIYQYIKRVALMIGTKHYQLNETNFENIIHWLSLFKQTYIYIAIILFSVKNFDNTC